MLDNPFSCRCVRRNCQESYFRKAIICPKMSLSDGRLFAAHGRICKFYPFPGSPPRRELWTATHPKRATKTAFRKCKRRIERHFWGTLPLRFPVRPPTAPLFHRMRITFRLPGRILPYGPSPGLFPGFHRVRHADLRPWHAPVCRSAHPYAGCVRIVRIINSETESTKKRLHVNLMLTMTAATGPSGFLM